MAKRWHASLAIAIAALSSCAALRAQSARVQDLGIGKLLVAPEDARDPIFAETVILLVRYDHNGTTGLVINRRSKVPISGALQSLKGAEGRSEPTYVGGPVEMWNVLGLLKANVMPEGADHVAGKLYLVSSRQLLEKTLLARPDPADFRVYLGYCGWSPGQLENETARGLWHIVPGAADLVFDTEPESLWSRLIARVGQRIARVNLGRPHPWSARPGL